MSIWSKVLLGLIFVVSLGMFYLAVSTLAANRAWREAAKSYDAPLERARKEAAQIEEGNDSATPPVPSPSQLDVKLHDLMVGRGKVWRGCVRRNADANLQLLVEVPVPDPHLINDKMVLYVFEEGEGGHYLGEYKVTGLAEKQVTLAPTMIPPIPKLLDQLRGRIAASAVQWSLYEKLPTDRHDVFRGYNQAQLAQAMPGVPPQVLEEFLRDGSDTQAGDAPERVIKGKYERMLRDYGVHFHELSGEIAQLRDQIAAAKTDKAIAEKLRADTEKETEARQTLIDKTLKTELAEVKQELGVITAHRDHLTEKFEAVIKLVKQTLAQNKRLLERWREIQISTAKRLNEVIEGELSGQTPSYTGE
ncbi:MAG TPA: hypothetical protein VG125_01230 [Pirellulales bacterium]|jgi:hypothetical protein|nr:hypothetical protein [Pirellulales bacterium]